jgi:glycosyltransferase involved in cell wall biosynthesis
MKIQEARKNKGYNLSRIRSLFDISGGITSSFTNLPFKNRGINSKVRLIYASRDIIYGLKTAFQLLFDCLNSSIDVHLVITGNCKDEDVKNLFDEYPYLKICANFFTLTGFVSTYELDSYVYNSDIGLAFYPITGNSSSTFGDPEKIRRYFNSGLPIVATGTGESIELINNTSSGIVCSSSIELFAAITKLINNKQYYNECSFNSYKVGESYKSNDKFLNFIKRIN